MNPNLMFIAGRITGERGWHDAFVIGVAELPNLNPTGEPVVVVADTAQVTTLAARLITSVSAMGRDIMLVTDEQPDADVMAWLHADIVEIPGKQKVPKLVDEERPKGATVEEILAKADVPGHLQSVPGLVEDEPDDKKAQKAKPEEKKSSGQASGSKSKGGGRVSSEAIREFQSLAQE
ncbi:MAG: hypothetical protein KDC39_07645 [Actinobacteria bacterium]|nr:hypothetical protein [Actinomycetota bacterium]